MKIVVSLIWLIVSSYLAVVGWNAADVYKVSAFDGRSYDYEYKPAASNVPVTVNFATKGDVEEFKRLQRWEEGDWGALVLSWMPRNYAALLVPMIFGLLGGAFGSIIMLWREDGSASMAKVLLQPLVGLIIGAMFYAMSMFIPKLLVSQETSPSWYTLIWLSMFGGIFAEQALNFAKKNAEKFFGSAPRAKKSQQVAEDES